MSQETTFDINRWIAEVTGEQPQAAMPQAPVSQTSPEVATPEAFDINRWIAEVTGENTTQNTSLPVTESEKQKAISTAYVNDFNQQVGDYKTALLQELEQDPNRSWKDRFIYDKYFLDNQLSVPKYNAYLQYAAQFENYLAQRNDLSKEAKAQILADFERQANPLNKYALSKEDKERADVLDKIMNYRYAPVHLKTAAFLAHPSAGDKLINGGISFSQLGERLANNFGARNFASNYFRDVSNSYDKILSPKAQIESHIVNHNIQEAERTGGQFEAAKMAAKMALEYPDHLANLATQELTAQLGLTGLGTILGGPEVGEAIASFTGAGLEMGALLGEWANQVEKLPQAQLEKFEPYQRRIKAGMTPEQARADLANTNFFEDDGLKPHLTAAAALGSFDRFLSIAKAGGALAKQSATRLIVKSILSDALRETIQEGSAQVNQNLAIQNIKPEQEATQGLGAATVYGGLLGGVSGTVGGAMQAVAASETAKQQKTVDDLINPDINETNTASPYRSALDEQLAKLEDKDTRQQFEDDFLQDERLGLLEKRRQARGAYGDFVRSVLEETSTTSTASPTPTTPTPTPESATATPENSENTKNTANGVELEPTAEQAVSNEQAVGNPQHIANVAPTEARNIITGMQDEIDIGSGHYQPFQYEIISANDLNATQQKADNQFRDRDRAASQMQINNMARNLDPRKLVASPTMDIGAPLLAQDGKTVIAGNGRSMAIQQAYNEGNAQHYRQYLKENANKFGIDASQIDGIENPVLVRRLNTAVDIAQTAINSNEQGGMRMSNLEQAKVDAQRLPNLDYLNLGENGELNGASNRPFIEQFIANQPDNLRNELLDSKGRLSQTGVQRVRNALLYSAFGDTDTLARAVESTVQGARNIINALVRIAPKTAQVKQDIAKGTLNNVDISNDIVSAVEKYHQLKTQNQNVSDYLSQQDFVSELSPEAKAILQIFNENARSSKRISDIFENYYRTAETQANASQFNMFGDVDFDKAGTLEQAKKADLDERYSRSPIKSVEANIKRGREAMNTAIVERRTVHRAMFNHNLNGWVDFEWGDVGRMLPNGKTKGAMGISHIIESRMRKDNMSYAQATRMLTDRVVETIAKGNTSQIYESGKVKSVFIEHNGNRATLIKREGSNSWLMNAFELKPTDEQVGSNDPSLPTQTLPTRQRQGMGAVGTANVQQTAPQRNSQTQADQQALSQILGEEIASHIEVVDRNTVKPPKGQTIESLKNKNVEGWYDRSTQKIYIYSEGITEAFGLTREERLAWVAWHELAHKGLNVKYGNTLKSALQQARKHPVVGVISRRIQQRNPSYSEEVAIEEALVELYSAYKTGDWTALNQRYNTRIHPSYALNGKVDMGNIFKRFAAIIKRLIAHFSKNKRAEMMSEQALFDLIKGVDESVKELEGGKLNSNEDTEEGVLFSVYSDDADKIDRAVTKMGLTSRRDSSRVSASEYVIIFDENNEEAEDFKIRVSNHTLPSGYEQANFEVQAKGAKQSKGLTDGSWVGAVAAIAEHFGKTMPKYVQNLSAKEKAQQQALKEAQNAFIEAQKALAEKHKAKTDTLAEQVKQNLNHYREGLAYITELEKEGQLGYRRTKSRKHAFFIFPDGEEVNVENYFPKTDPMPSSVYDFRQRLQSLIQQAEAESDVRYSLNEDPHSEFVKAVDDFIDGNEVKTSISMGTTPDVLKMIGLPDAEVKIQRKTLGKAMRGKHAIEPETLKQLPQQLNDPVGVFQSSPRSSNPDGYVVLTELTEFNQENNRDEPVIVALHLDQTGEVQLIEVASAYGKNHQGLQNILNKDKVYYWNKTKGLQLANAHWLQLPLKLRSDANLSERDIKTEADLSQYQSEHSAEVETETDSDIRYSRRDRHSLEDDVARGYVEDLPANPFSLKHWQSKVIEWVNDDTQPVKDFIDQLPISKGWQKTIKNDLDLSQTKRKVLIEEYEQRYIKPLLKNVADLANRYDKDVLSTKRYAEYWASLRWAISKNAELLAKDEQALLDAEEALNEAVKSGSDAEIEKAERAVEKAERKYLGRKADVETADWRNHKPIVGTAGGWSTPQAVHIKAEIEKIFPAAEIEKTLAPLFEMLRHKLDVDLKAGRISPELYAKYQKNGEYVPLTGNPDEDPEMDFIASLSDENVNTGTDKAMQGRKNSISEGAIDATWREIAKSTTLAGFADFKQGLFEVYDSLIDEQVKKGKSRVEAEKFVQDEYKMARSLKKGLTRPSDKVLIHKHQGAYYEIHLPEKAIDALTHSHKEKVNSALAWVSTPTKWAARGYTQWRVDFALKNMLRDIGERSLFITSREMYKPNGERVGIKERHLMGMKIFTQIMNPKVWKASARYAAFGIKGLRDNVPVEANFKSLIREGGVSTIGSYLAHSERQLLKQIKAHHSKLAKTLEVASGVLEKYNKIFDMISSIATAHVLRQHGLDAKMTAATTLNLSNFTHTGSKMRFIKALFAFSQPTAMGGRNLLSHLKTKEGIAQFTVLVAAGMMLYSFLRAMDEEDETGNKMDATGDISREILIPTGNGEYIKIPVPFGMQQMAWNISTNVVRAWEKGITSEDAATNIAMQFLKGNFAFISPSEISANHHPGAKIADTFTPTFFKAVTQQLANVSAFGSKIYPENRGDSLNIELSKPTTNQMWKDFAEEVYDQTGLDLQPEIYQYTFNSYARMLGTIGEMAIHGIENPNRELLGRKTVTPVLNSFYGPKGENSHQSMYYQYMEQAQQVVNEHKRLKETRKLKADWLTTERKALIELHKYNKEKKKNLQEDYRAILAYRKQGNFRDDVYKRRLALHYRKAEKLQRDIVYRYRRIMGLYTVRK